MNFNAFLLIGENNFIDNCQTNEISNGLWDYQKQDFNEIQESNSDNDNFVMIKHIRLVIDKKVIMNYTINTIDLL